MYMYVRISFIRHDVQPPRQKVLAFEVLLVATPVDYSNIQKKKQ